MPLVSTVTPDGPEIRARRERLGLTQEQLGRLAGHHPRTVSDIERGAQAVASMIMIGRFARVLKTAPERLIKTGPERLIRDREAQGAIATASDEPGEDASEIRDLAQPVPSPRAPEPQVTEAEDAA